jgi:hypothetical protein
MRLSSLVDRRLVGLVDAMSVSTVLRDVEPHFEPFIESGTLLGPEGSARQSWDLGPHIFMNRQTCPVRVVW